MAIQMATATNAHYFAIGCRFGQGLDPNVSYFALQLGQWNSADGAALGKTRASLRKPRSAALRRREFKFAQLFFEVLDGHSVDNRVIVANHRQRTGQRTFGHRWLRDELRR
jgi:hypothetical protein